MSEQARRQNNTDKALALLRARGSVGATNAELVAVAGFRYGARIHSLRESWHIETRHESGGRFRFVLRGPKQPGQQELFA